MESGRSTSRGSSRCTRSSRSWARPGTPRPMTTPARALAYALEVTHRRLHERLKPDETAEGHAFAAARQKDPAANLNAQSIVIHPMQRPGAPASIRPRPASSTAHHRPPPLKGRTDNESNPQRTRRRGHRGGPDITPGHRRVRSGAREDDHRRAAGSRTTDGDEGRDDPEREIRGHHRRGRDPVPPLQRRDRREAPARDDGRGRRVPRLRPRRRPGPVLRQLVVLAPARGQTRARRRHCIATTARGISRTSRRPPGWTRPSTARASRSATTTTTATRTCM